MAIVEIRETLEQASVVIEAGDIAILQKKVSLQSGKRYTMMSVDFMDDSFSVVGEVGVAMEFFLSPYPIIYTEMTLGGGAWNNRGPLASDDSVLFKETMFWYAGSGVGLYTERLPNNFLGALPTYSWYTPTMYLTAIYHNSTGIDITLTDVALSVYASLKTKNADTVEFGMGIIGEYDEAQGRNLMSQGRIVPTGSNVQQTFPMWRTGGIRPEFTLRADALADFWVPGFGQDNEKVTSVGDMQVYIKAARQMVSSLDAFGKLDVAKGFIPDWLRFEAAFAGAAYGVEAAEMPPVLKHDNGNTRVVVPNA